MKNLILAAMSVTLLAACGGGSGTGSSGNKTPPSAKRIVTQQHYLTDDCGELLPNAQAEFIEHDASGAVVATHKSDSQGQFSVELNSKTKHLTIHTTDIRNGYESKYLRTFLDIQAGDLGTAYSDFSLSGECECAKAVLQLDGLEGVYSGYSLRVSSERVTKTSGNFNYYNTIEVPVCDAQETLNLRLHNTSSGDLVAGKINVSGNQTYQLTSQDFPFQGQPVIITDYVENPKYAAWGYNGDRASWWSNSSTNGEPVFFVPGQVESFMARVYDYVQEEVNGFDIIVQNYATGPVSADGEVDFSLLPSLGEVRARLESSLIAFAENQNESFSYDLSGIHEDADLANFAFSFSGQIPTYWSIEGQLKGTVPALSLTPELEAFFEQAPFDSVDFQMFVDGLTGVQGVQAFRNMFYGQSPQQRNEDGSSGVYFYLFETILNIPL